MKKMYIILRWKVLKINEIKNKITNIYNLTTTTAFTAVENNIPQKANFDVD